MGEPRTINVENSRPHSNQKADSGYEELKMQLCAELRCKSPHYMIPAFIEVLDDMPTLPSGKDGPQKAEQALIKTAVFNLLQNHLL